jgi:hypothetical protein
MAAWAAARRRLPGNILVVDRMPASGVKLAVTGGGRGNLSHLSSEDQFAAAFGRQGRFTIPAFRSLPPDDLRLLLAQAGVPTTVDPVGRIYPNTQSAAQMRDALFQTCVQAGVKFIFNHRVERILPPAQPQDPWQVDAFSARSVLLAAGGQSAARLGSDGSGFALAKSMGYEVIPPAPALTSLRTSEEWPAAHSGLSLPDVTIALAGERGAEASEQGELLFTHRGISGPAVLNLSGRVARRLLAEQQVGLRITLLREMPDFGQLRKSSGTRPILAWLAQCLPRTLAGTLLELSGIASGETCSRLTAAQEKQLVLHLGALPLTVRSTGGFVESMATSGGVALKQVRPETLEGRRFPRLYFAGEILDLVGPTGGWNLQWAFCSGHLVGTVAASG